MPLNGRDRNAEERSRFFGAEPDEKAQFDQIGFERVLSFQTLNGLIHHQQCVVVRTSCHVDALEIDPLKLSTVFDSGLPARILDQDPAHGFRGRSEEMRAVPPFLGLASSHAQPRFVDQSGGLQGLARWLARQLLRCQLAQLLVKKRHQLRRICGVALQHFKDTGYVAHKPTVAVWTPE